MVENYVPCNLGPYKEVESWFASCSMEVLVTKSALGLNSIVKGMHALYMWSLLLMKAPKLEYIYIYGKACSKDGHQRHMFYDEIGVCTQITDINLSSTFNTIGRVFVITSSERGSSLWSLVNYASQLRL